MSRPQVEILCTVLSRQDTTVFSASPDAKHQMALVPTSTASHLNLLSTNTDVPYVFEEATFRA